jgi:hypothetical protein
MAFMRPSVRSRPAPPEVNEGLALFVFQREGFSYKWGSLIFMAQGIHSLVSTDLTLLSNRPDEPLL